MSHISLFMLMSHHTCPHSQTSKYKRLRERRLVLSHSWCMAELEFKPSCVQFQSTCFFFFFFSSLRRKINGDFLGFLPSSQMSLSCQRQCAPDTSSFLLILGPACLCGGGRAGVALESAWWYSAPPLVSDSVWLE